MKKTLSLLLIAILVLACYPVSAHASSNVWDAVGPVATKEAPSNVVDVIGSKPVSTPTSTPKPSASSSATKTPITNDEDKLPTSTQGVVLPSDYSMPYAIKVDRINQVITVFSESNNGAYNVIEKQFICSTGTSKNKTPEGVFTLPTTRRREWRYFKTYNTYVRYAVHIEGDYFFHSLLYSKPDVSTLSRTSYRKLGKPASHGCIRMMSDDIKWMSENCLAGTNVFIMDCEKDKDLNKSLLPPKLS